jgi:two-component system, LytTR family, sensor kinase
MPWFLGINLIAGLAFVVILIIYDDWSKMPELMHRAFRPNVPYVPRPRNFYWDISNLLIFYMSVGISTSIAVVQKWQSDEKIRFELERQRTNSELSYLKARSIPISSSIR